MVPQRQNVSLLLGEVFATFGEGFAKQKCIKFTKQLCLHMQLLKSKNSMHCTTVGFAKTIPIASKNLSLMVKTDFLLKISFSQN